MTEETASLLNTALLVLRLVAHNAYQASQHLKHNYPDAYRVLSYVLVAFTAYRVARFAVRSLYSTLRSILKLVLLAYLVYMAVSVVLVLDESKNGPGGDLDLETQLILITTNLVHQLQSTFRLLRILSLALYRLAMRYSQLAATDPDFDDHLLPQLHSIPATLYTFFAQL